MKNIIFIILLTCCTGINNVDEIIEKNLSLKQADISLSFDGLGLDAESFSNARVIADWDHLISDISAEIKINNIDNGSRLDFSSQYNELNSFTTSLPYANYIISIAQLIAPINALTFAAISDTINVNDTTGAIDMDVSTAQALILIDSDIVYPDSIPMRISGSAESNFYLRLGFWYMYVLEIPNDRKYTIKFYDNDLDLREFDIIGAQRETIYFINISGNEDINFNFNIDSLFTDTIIIG